MENKRDTRITVDLLAYKKPWLDWCKAEGLRPADALRRIIAGIVADKAAAPATPAQIQPDQPERTTCRKEIALTPSELAKVEAIAAAEGFSVPKWLVALVRARLTNTGQYGQQELETLARSNSQLLKIGRNLNQVARVLNAAPHDRPSIQVDQIKKLDALIRAHTKNVCSAMTANIERWRLN